MTHPPRFSMEIGRLAAALPSSILLLLLLMIITGGAVVVESATDSSDGNPFCSFFIVPHFESWIMLCDFNVLVRLFVIGKMIKKIDFLGFLCSCFLEGDRKK